MEKVNTRVELTHIEGRVTEAKVKARAELADIEGRVTERESQGQGRASSHRRDSGGG